jgi:hypothetical protein
MPARICASPGDVTSMPSGSSRIQTFAETISLNLIGKPIVLIVSVPSHPALSVKNAL